MAGLQVVRDLPEALRAANWQITAYYDTLSSDGSKRLITIAPGDRTDRLFGVAIDIGTTTVVVYLVDLRTAKVLGVASAYNAQIARGEDVISRIVYSLKNDHLKELQDLVVSTINGLLADVLKGGKVKPEEVLQVVVAGNTTMSHLFMRISPRFVREQPYIPAANHYPSVPARRSRSGGQPERHGDHPSRGGLIRGRRHHRGSPQLRHVEDRETHDVHRRGYQRRDRAGQR